ncbi:MAG TPA: phosphoribosyltransferase family protein, partial [Thermodesulfobacteriota bacterium]|nr:phosphoribosyltransferase family protein [Thermodesulfobacteriota bacterium]
MPEDLKLIMTPEEVAEVVSRLAEEISSDYRESTPVFVGVLKGASVFLSDLVRALKTPHEVDFIQTSAYGMREAPGEVVKVTREITADITGRDVIIVEGIVDRGLTAGTVKKHLAAKGPATLKVCTLLMREGGA